VRRLEKKRDRRARRLQRLLSREEPVAALTSVLRKALRRRAAAGMDPLAPSGQALDDCAAAVLVARAQVRGWQDDQPLHRLRIAIKKYRGALMALGDGRSDALAELQKVQQVLGEHHDWSELGRRLRQAALKSRKGTRAQAYQALLARAAEEQGTRFDSYRADWHDRLPSLVAGHLPATRRPRPSPARRSTAPDRGSPPPVRPTLVPAPGAVSDLPPPGSSGSP
jgi:CHAD domain-containing protein